MKKRQKKKNVQKLIQNKNYKYTKKKKTNKKIQRKRKIKSNDRKISWNLKQQQRKIGGEIRHLNHLIWKNSKELQGQHNIQMTEKSTEIELKSKLFRLPLSLCASVCCSGSGTVDMDFKLIDFGLIDALGINSPVLMITSDNPPAAFSSIWLPTSVFCSSFPSSCLPSLPEVSILRQQKNNNNKKWSSFWYFPT